MGSTVWKILWKFPRKYLGNFYSFLLVIIFSIIFLHDDLIPEWLARLILFWAYLPGAIFYCLWLALNPKSIVVNKRLLDPEKIKARRCVEPFARIFLFAMGAGLIWAVIVPVVKDSVGLFKYGSEALVFKRATIERSNEVGMVGFLYRNIYFTGGDMDGHSYFLPLAPRLPEGIALDFIMLRNSKMILEIRKPSSIGSVSKPVSQ